MTKYYSYLLITTLLYASKFRKHYFNILKVTEEGGLDSVPPSPATTPGGKDRKKPGHIGSYEYFYSLLNEDDHT